MKFFLRLMSRLIITVLAGDLIYLYFAGGWYDPIKAIEVTELIILSGLVISGIYLTHKEAKEISRELTQ
jgi:hypothetical protein